LATPATIVYACSLIDFSKQVGILFPPAGNNVLGPAAQKISDALRTAGIGPEDWNAAFGSELSLISDWSEQMRWPSVVLTAPVREVARARKIVDALVQGAEDGAGWEQTDRNSVHYWSLTATTGSGWFSIRPIMALSD